MGKETKKPVRREAGRSKADKGAKRRGSESRTKADLPAGPGGYEGDDRPPIVLAVDVALFAVREDELVVLLVERSREPQARRWALPGAVVEPEETMASAARRAVTGRTGIVEPFTRLEQVRVFDGPTRDPRTRVVSSTLLAVCRRAVPAPGGPLASGRWWPVGADSGPTLAFDHGDILAAAVEELRSRLERSDLATAFVGEPFTLGDLRRAYEAAWETDLEPANFRRKILSTPGFVEATGATRAVGTGRPADLYRRGAGSELRPPMLRPG
jgi:8-oxo-dGTP diphosphatase